VYLLCIPPLCQNVHDIKDYFKCAILIHSLLWETSAFVNVKQKQRFYYGGTKKKQGECRPCIIKRKNNSINERTLRGFSPPCYKQIWKVWKVGKLGKVGKVGNVGKLGKVGKEGRVGQVGKVGKEGKEGKLRE
jgi:hypothetical protein